MLPFAQKDVMKWGWKDIDCVTVKFGMAHLLSHYFLFSCLLICFVKEKLVWCKTELSYVRLLNSKLFWTMMMSRLWTNSVYRFDGQEMSLIFLFLGRELFQNQLRYTVLLSDDNCWGKYNSIKDDFSAVVKAYRAWSERFVFQKVSKSCYL